MSGITLIKLSDISLGANTRKTVNDESIKGLAESLKQVGMIQPMVLRIVGNKHVVVCGERRYRAAKLAKLNEVPCIVKELTDEEAEDLTITENLQREDISPLDEAEAYLKLINNRQYTPAMISARFGKSESYVRHRLKLNELIEPIANLLREDILSISHCLEIAKLSPKMQAALHSDRLPTNPNSGWAQIPTVAMLKQTIQNRYSSRLDNATFNLNYLYTCSSKACKDCPFNTHFNAMLFPDMQDSTKGICMDPDCYSAKTTEAFELNLQQVITENPSMKLVASGYLYGDKELELKKLQKEGYIIEKINSNSVLEAPEQPDPNEFNMDDPDDLEEYQDQVKVYENELDEYTQAMNSENLITAFCVVGDEKGKFVKFIPETNSSSGEEPGTGNKIDSAAVQIADLKLKAENFEKVRNNNVLAEVMALLKTEYEKIDSDLRDDELLCIDLIMFQSSASHDFINEIGLKYSFDDNRLAVLRSISPENRYRLCRQFILNGLRIDSYNSETAQLIVNIAWHFFPDAYKEIYDHMDEIYQKRKRNIDSRIFELQRPQQVLPIAE